MLHVIIFYSMPCSLFSFIISESDQTSHVESNQLLLYFLGRVVRPDGTEVSSAGAPVKVNPESTCYILSPEITLGLC